MRGFGRGRRSLRSSAVVRYHAHRRIIRKTPTVQEYQRTFIDLALSRTALRFGIFKLKSGRESPYFFNAGLFNDGEAIAVLGKCYAAALARSGPRVRHVVRAGLQGHSARHHHRRRARRAPPSQRAVGVQPQGSQGSWRRRQHRRQRRCAGRVVIVDDVITAGTAIRESVEIIRAAGATPGGVALALDRQERGQGTQSAVQEVSAQFGLRCVSILTLAELIETFAAGRRVMQFAFLSEQFAALQCLPARMGRRRRYPPGANAGAE